MSSRPVGRICRRSVFVALRRPAGRAAAGPVKVSWMPPADDFPSFPVVGYAIGRRCGGAVQRNRLRRRLRAAVVKVGPQPGAYLITAEPWAQSLDFAELVTKVGSAMDSAAARGTRP